MKPSARIVLDMIARPDGACGGDFLDRGIGRFGGRIHELRQLGYVIALEPCRMHSHPYGGVTRYRLVAVPETSGQTVLVVGA